MREDLHRLQIEPVDGWASAAADLFERAIRAVLAQRDHCSLGVSGGPQPQPVFDELATRDLPWARVVMIQIDELLVSPDHPERHLGPQQATFTDLGVTWLSLPVDRLLTTASMAEAAIEAIDDVTTQLVELADEPPIIDVVQLCLRPDGSTASLFPDDPAAAELRRYVALTEPHDGHRRLTMTRPVFDRARLAIWLVRGSAVAAPLGRLLAGDLSIPAGVIRPRQSIVLADTDAARQR
jgi:6-phosphogluconolactonase/glucosamine-6-phosphate isomerase/deaminase